MKRRTKELLRTVLDYFVDLLRARRIEVYRDDEKEPAMVVTFRKPSLQRQIRRKP